MKLWFGFEGWRAFCEVMCGLLLVFSFIGEKELGNMYSPLLFGDILFIVIGFFCMLITRYFEVKNGIK